MRNDGHWTQSSSTPDTVERIRAPWAKAEQVWCSDNRNGALTLAKLDKDFQTRDCDSSIVSTHYSMGQDVGLRGTPAIVLEDGTLFSGYLAPKQLIEAIASTNLASGDPALVRHSTQFGYR